MDKLANTANAILRENAIALLDASQQAAAARIARWDLEFALERLEWEGKLPEHQGSFAEIEFKRFFLLIALGVNPIAMISPLIDEVWHQLVLFTRRYEAFCNDTVGCFVHHTPETPSNPIPVEAARNFLNAYRRLYGQLPEIWYFGMSTEVRREYEEGKLLTKPKVRWSGWTGEDRRLNLRPFQF